MIISMHTRAQQGLSLGMFGQADVRPTDLGVRTLSSPEDQYILRMMVMSPVHGFSIPSELEWLKSTILGCISYQRQRFPLHPFIYITVRSGEVRSETDDLLHVDGFSMRVSHLPEQNYIWSAGGYPTEVLTRRVGIPGDFDPLRHNLHWLLQDKAREEDIKPLRSGHLYVIDPYIAHRRPKVPPGVKRTFFRISFVPIEIQDDTCTRNPAFPAVHYGKIDFRHQLERYPISKFEEQ